MIRRNTRTLSLLLSILIIYNSFVMSINASQAEEGTVDFITRCYEIALGRSPDEGSLDEWVRKLDSGETCGVAVAYGFVYSQEFQNGNFSNSVYVDKMYNMLLGRDPDEEGKAYWVEKLDNGESKENIFYGFSNSQEFFNLCESYGIFAGHYVNDIGMERNADINCFVNRFYEVCLGRKGDITGQTSWVEQLAEGSLTGTSLALGFIFSPEYIAKNTSNTVYVKTLYNTFLGREADNEGLKGWKDFLDDGTKSREEVFNGFCGSVEFDSLCMKYGIERGEGIEGDTYTPVTQSTDSSVTPTDSSKGTPSVTSTVTPTVRPGAETSLATTGNSNATHSVTPTITPGVETSVTPTGSSNATPSVTPTVTPTVTPDPTPTEDPEPEALRIAEIVGLSKEDLRGKYDLFIRYAHAVDENSKLGQYNGYVYSIFPVVADHIKPENEEYFLGKVSDLYIFDSETEDFAGGYLPSNTSIEISTINREEQGKGELGTTVIHELMHFIDSAIDGENTFICCTEDGYILENCYDRWGDSVVDSLYVIEGGSERYSAEYFTHVSGSYAYRLNQEFLVGLEYIFDKETVDDMYFSHNTEYILSDLLNKNGFNNDEIMRFFLAQHIHNDYSILPTQCLDPREVLIRLYINNKGADYKNDSIFCAILSAMDNERLNSIPSEYQDSISEYKGMSMEELDVFMDYITSHIDVGDRSVYFNVEPMPIIIGGEIKMAAPLGLINWKDPLILVNVIFDYDFDTKTIKGISVYNQSEWIREPIESIDG